MPFRDQHTTLAVLLSLPVLTGAVVGAAWMLAVVFAWKAALAVTLGVVLFGAGYCCGNWERK